MKIYLSCILLFVNCSVFAGKLFFINLRDNNMPGFGLSAVSKLRVNNQNQVNGEFIWSFVSIDSAKFPTFKAYKNATITEYVRGYFNSDTKILTLHSYANKDEYHVWRLTKYVLNVSDDQLIKGVGGNFNGNLVGDYTSMSSDYNVDDIDPTSEEKLYLKSIIDSAVNVYVSEHRDYYPWQGYEPNTSKTIEVLDRADDGSANEVQALVPEDKRAQAFSVVYLLIDHNLPYYMHFTGVNSYRITPQTKSGQVTPQESAKKLTLQKIHNDIVSTEYERTGDESFNKVLNVFSRISQKENIGGCLISSPYTHIATFARTTRNPTNDAVGFNSDGTLQMGSKDIITYEQHNVTEPGLKNTCSHSVFIKGISCQQYPDHIEYTNISIRLQPGQTIPYINIYPGYDRAKHLWECYFDNK